MKIVINSDFGGFGLSDAAFERYLELKGIEFARVSRTFGSANYYKAGHIDEDDYYLWPNDIERNDPILIQIVEEMKEEANGLHSSLKIVEIPDDVEWIIQEYDGAEHISEKHRTWY
jgi:hypothetical protein